VVTLGEKAGLFLSIVFKGLSEEEEHNHWHVDMGNAMMLMPLFVIIHLRKHVN
jgi:hypothetical protein